MPVNPSSPSSQDAFSAFLGAFFGDLAGTGQGFAATRLAPDGSQRTFLRLVAEDGNLSVIAVKNPPLSRAARSENRSYLEIGRHLRGAGAPVPEMYRWSLKNGWFLIEDLGDRNLQAAASNAEERIPLYERVLRRLYSMQTRGAAGFDTAWCCQTSRYDLDVMRRLESDYFRDAFLGRYMGLDPSPYALDACFDYLAETASRAGAKCFMHRDFQSRNLMVRGDGIGVIDWQGGRLGPQGYDLASLLIDPYVNLEASERRHLYNTYRGMLEAHQPGEVALFEDTYPYLAIQRNLQILGAFGFLSRVRGKPFFEAFIAPAVHSLKGLLADLGDMHLSSLEALVRDLLPSWPDNPPVPPLTS
jgi:hypothetical protein